MTVRLFRVDERLIHGQVVVGWGRRLHPRRVIVVNDALSAAPLEQEIYRTGLPRGMDAEFWSEEQAIQRLPMVIEAEEISIVLTEDLATMWRLVQAGLTIGEINVGGIHSGPGRDRVLPYVCLGPDERRRVRDLEEAGVRVTAQDVPTAAAVRLLELERAR